MMPQATETAVQGDLPAGGMEGAGDVDMALAALVDARKRMPIFIDYARTWMPFDY